MTKVRRGGYVFLTWKGDHPPRHVHVWRGERPILKWNLEFHRPMWGHASRRLQKLIRELDEEGLL